MLCWSLLRTASVEKFVAVTQAYGSLGIELGSRLRGSSLGKFLEQFSEPIIAYLATLARDLAFNQVYYQDLPLSDLSMRQ